MAAPEKFASLDLTTHALLFDVDGTLLDIAPKPDQVHVPAELRDTLARLSDLTRGALALVSGRQIAVLDDLFKPLRLSAVGVHGAELRIGQGAVTHRAQPLPAALRQKLADGAKTLGVLSEDKGYSFTLHFRQVPDKQASVEQVARRICAEFPGEAVDIAHNKMVVEVARRGINKGAGVTALMTHFPFKGRTPVFVGDDATDETVFSIMPQLRGMAFSVDREFPGLAGIFASPAQFRSALQALAAR
jgi:trehalose 6-phosphate phosphatase